MLGKIIAIEDNLIELDLSVNIEEMDNIINYYEKSLKFHGGKYKIISNKTLILKKK